MDVSELITLFRQAGALKKVKRAGWERKNIENPESVADHTFRTAFIAMVLGERAGLDVLKLLKMCLVHDLAEAVTGDITPFDEIAADEKKRREEEEIKQLFDNVPGGGKYVELWTEYEEGKSEEAAVARCVDKLEMALQAGEYQEEYPEIDLSEFFKDLENEINIPEIKTLYEEIMKRAGRD